METTPTTPHVGVKGRRARVGRERPCGTADKQISGEVVAQSLTLEPPGTINLEQGREPHTDPKLTDEQVEEFRELYRLHLSEDIGYEEAYEKGVKLVHLMELIYKPMTAEQYQRLQDRRRETGLQ